MEAAEQPAQDGSHPVHQSVDSKSGQSEDRQRRGKRLTWAKRRVDSGRRPIEANTEGSQSR
jgi:hypothetical protein